jgi:hypothetical protein
MLGNIQDQLGVWRRPIVRFLLTPAGAKDARGLPDDLSDLLTKDFVVTAVTVDAFDANICAQVNAAARDTTSCTCPIAPRSSSVTCIACASERSSGGNTLPSSSWTA